MPGMPPLYTAACPMPWTNDSAGLVRCMARHRIPHTHPARNSPAALSELSIPPRRPCPTWLPCPCPASLSRPVSLTSYALFALPG